jgi:hypothetical protein
MKRRQPSSRNPPGARRWFPHGRECRNAGKVDAARPPPRARDEPCRAVAVSLLSLGALLAATVPHADAVCVNPPTGKPVCVTVTACDPTHPTTCCAPLGINCAVGCTPPLSQVCCLALNPTNPQACNIQPPPCDPTQPTTCCPPTIITCRIGCTNLTQPACCILNNPTNPQVCVNCTVDNPQVCCLLEHPTNPLVCVPPPPPPQCPPGTADLDGDCDCGTEPGDPADACVPQPPSATCLADGILVTAKDLLGGDTRSAYSESVATANGVPGPYTPPPAPAPQPPAQPQAHADAHQATFHYDNSLVSVDAQGLHSRCDVDANAAGFTDAYGRGGVADLQVKVLGNVLHLDAVDFEEQALGTPAATTGAWACDAVEAEANPPPSLLAVCNFGIALGAGVVTVTLNEANPPVFDPGSSEWVYQGSHVHINLALVAANVDLYVGYVRVGVSGGPAAPPTYTGHTCLAPAPLCS